jgi:hypothetical protein
LRLLQINNTLQAYYIKGKAVKPRLFVNPIPFIPFPLPRGRGIIFFEGANAPSYFPKRKEEIF